MGYSYIKKHLKEKGYKTTGGNDFSDTAIHTILTNQKYKGTYTYDRTAAKDSEGHRNSHKIKPDPIEIPDGMPAIIEPALFDKVQEKLAQNRRRTASRTGKNYYALNGFTRCPKCGKPLVMREARRGAHVGEKFWGCTGFPQCHFIKKIVKTENK